MWFRTMGIGWLATAAVCVFPLAAAGQEESPPEQSGFVGGLEPAADSVVAVRNDAHQPGDEIVTLRYFRIRPGSFDSFVEASREGVWPYFEKLGARVIGMWQVVGRDGPPDGEPSPEREYDEVYLATRYASVDHWRSTRETVRHGGNGPDWDGCLRALELRRGLTLSTHLTFLRGEMAPGGPYFMPGLGESYRLVEE